MAEFCVFVFDCLVVLWLDVLFIDKYRYRLVKLVGGLAPPPNSQIAMKSIRPTALKIID